MRSPPSSMSRTSNQVSTSEVMPYAAMLHVSRRRGEAGHQQRDALRLQEVDQPRQHRVAVAHDAGAGQCRDRIEHHGRAARSPRTARAPSPGASPGRRVVGRLASMRSSPLSIDPALQVDADRAHVAHQLRRRLLEREVQAALAASAAWPRAKARGQRGLAGAGGAGEQHRAAAEVARAAEHGVEPRHAAGHPLVGHLVLAGRPR